MQVLDNFDIYARRGDSHGVWIDLLAEAPDGTKTVVPFENGDTVRLSIKTSSYDTEPLVQLEKTEFEEGRAHFEFRPDDTKGLAFMAYCYDVELVRASGYTKTIIPPKDDDPLPKFVITEEVT